MSRENTNNRVRREKARLHRVKRAKDKAAAAAYKLAKAEDERLAKELKLWKASLKLKRTLVERETGEWWAYHMEEDGTLLSKKIKELWPDEAHAQLRGLPSPRFGKEPNFLETPEFGQTPDLLQNPKA